MTKSKNSNQYSDSGIDDFIRGKDRQTLSKTRLILITSLILGIIGILVVGVWLIRIDAFNLETDRLKAITEYQAPDNSLVLDRHGEKVGEYYSAYYIYTPLAQIPKEMIDAVIAIEDRNYFTHSGVDLKAIIRALINVVKTRSMSQGASTITQQVVRNFLLSREKTLERKVKEIIYSIRLEKVVTKDQILEIYLNALFLGNGAYGVAAAAKRYFDSPLQELTIAEFALIAGLFQSPSGFNPHRFPKKAKKRQKQVLTAMARSGKITWKQARRYYAKKLRYKPYNSVNTAIAPYFIDYVRERASKLLGKSIKNSGLRIYTTLDIAIQTKAQTAINNKSRMLNRARAYLKSETMSDNNRLEAAVLVSDPHSGEILAMVGGRDYATSQFNRTVQAKRSPGSAFKPVIYSLALQNGYKWSDMFYVTPIVIDDYRPRNYSASSFLKETTLLKAFYKSTNTTVVELGRDLGLKSILRHAERLGVRTTLKDEVGTMLGSSEVTMLDLTRMYSVFANEGKLVEPIAISKITSRDGEVLYEAPEIGERETEVISPHLAYLITEGLRSVFKYGTAYNFRRMAEFAVGKTGTSNDSKDNWFCGYTPDLVTILWAGIDDHQGFEDSSVSAVTLALPIWASFVQKVYPERPQQEFIVPAEGIIEHKISPNFGHLDDGGISMYFFEGQEPEKNGSGLQLISRSGNYRGIFDR